MKNRIGLAISAVALLLLAGGTTGGIYTHTVSPLGRNMHATEMAKSSGQGDIKQIAIQGISVTWGDNALGEIARKNGISELLYADQELLSVFGIWRQETIHLYGR
jgi:hypothetical protein